MTSEEPMPRVSQERPLFTWLVRVAVLANAVVVALLIYFWFSTW